MPPTPALRLLVFALAAPAFAQWSTNPGSNLRLSSAAGEQLRTQCAPGLLGSTWIAWVDRASGNDELRLQLLSSNGIERFPPGGLLVSSHPSGGPLVEWHLAGDYLGCTLVVCDARAGADLDVHAYRFDFDGNFRWGPHGVTLSSNNTRESTPRSCRTNDGSFVVVWTRSPFPTEDTLRMQRLDVLGIPQLPAEGRAIVLAGGEDPGVAGLVASGASDCIVAWIRETAATASTRHLRAQRFDPNGNPVWPGFVSVYDAAPLPPASVPAVVADNAHGAYLGWNGSAGGSSDALVQHLDANGVELWPHGGVSVCDQGGQDEFDPSLAPIWDGKLLVAFHRRDPAQSFSGVGVQRIEPNGVLAWGSYGVDVAAFDALHESSIRCVADDWGGATALWLEHSGPGPDRRVLAHRVDASGQPVWTPGTVALGTSPSAKDGLEVAGPVATWRDARNDAGDVYAQNVWTDGALGPRPEGWGFCAGDGLDPFVTTACPCGNNGGPGRGCASSFEPQGGSLGAIGSTSLDDVVLSASGLNPAGACTFYCAQWVVQGGVSYGDGLSCLGATLIRLRTVSISAGAALFPSPIETSTLSARSATYPGSGMVCFYSVAYRNAAAAFCPPQTVNATNGWTVMW